MDVECNFKHFLDSNKRKIHLRFLTNRLTRKLEREIVFLNPQNVKVYMYGISL